MQLFVLTVLSMGIHLIGKPCFLNLHVFVLVPWSLTAGMLQKPVIPCKTPHLCSILVINGFLIY